MTLKATLQQLSTTENLHNILLTSLKHSVKIGRDCEGNWAMTGNEIGDMK